VTICTEKRHKRGENDAAAEIHHSTEFRLIDTHREELVVHGTTPETRHSSSGQPDDKVKTCITDAQQTNIAADKTSSTDEASRVFNRKRETGCKYKLLMRLLHLIIVRK